MRFFAFLTAFLSLFSIWSSTPGVALPKKKCVDLQAADGPAKLRVGPQFRGPSGNDGHGLWIACVGRIGHLKLRETIQLLQSQAADQYRVERVLAEAVDGSAVVLREVALLKLHAGVAVFLNIDEPAAESKVENGAQYLDGEFVEVRFGNSNGGHVKTWCDGVF